MCANDETMDRFMDVIATTAQGREIYRQLAERAFRSAAQWHEVERSQPESRRNDLAGIGTHIERFSRTPLRLSVYGRPLDGSLRGPEELYRDAYARSVRNNAFLAAMLRHWLDDRRAFMVSDASAIRLLTWQARDAFDEEEYLAGLLKPSVAWNIRQEVKPSPKRQEGDPSKKHAARPRFSRKELSDPSPVYEEIARLQGRTVEDVRSTVERRTSAGADLTESLVEEYGAYAPSGTMVGIDLETTGVSPHDSYIVDAGWESFDMDSGSAFDAERHTYGIPSQRMRLGIKPGITALTGISAQSVAGSTPFQEAPDMQRRIMDALDGNVMVAHNARFERAFLMSNCAGFAEALREGRIAIIDSMMVARHSEDTRDQGFKLDDYARRNHALDDDRDMQVPSVDGGMIRLDQGEQERHLGLEDTHIMMRAMRNQLNLLHERHGRVGAVKRGIVE